jgi:DnaJ-class molecular chaperone
MSGGGSSSDLYSRLGVERGVSTEDLKKAYKRAALVAHPDKPTGSKEKFQAVNEAYTVLSNPDARAEYDRTGRVPQGGEAPPPPADLSEILGSLFGGGFGVPGGFPIPMHMMFGGGPGGGGGAPVLRRARGPNKIHEIGVTLAELWAGKVFTLNMKRDVLCSGCGGSGGREFRTCEPCSGRGFRIVRQQLGPMLVTSQDGCGDCRGAGRVAGAVCDDCGGRRVIETEKTLDVRVERGMAEGERIVFSEACSESPDFEKPGDVVLVLRAAAGDTGVWERRGSALIVEVSLSVAESLLGWERRLEGHPSGSIVPVVWEGGAVRDREVLRVPGWGMPVRGSEDPEFGDLLIICRVQVQDGTWSEEQLRALQSVWPEWKKPVGDGAHRAERASQGEGDPTFTGHP